MEKLDRTGTLGGVTARRKKDELTSISSILGHCFHTAGKRRALPSRRKRHDVRSVLKGRRPQRIWPRNGVDIHYFCSLSPRYQLVRVKWAKMLNSSDFQAFPQTRVRSLMWRRSALVAIENLDGDTELQRSRNSVDGFLFDRHNIQRKRTRQLRAVGKAKAGRTASRRTQYDGPPSTTALVAKR